VAELNITLPDGHAICHQLGTEPLVMGRDVACDLFVDDPGASRNHAQFVLTPTGYVVEDLGSKNGTLVNNEPCVRLPLKHGDRVLIGSTVAVFSDEVSHKSQSVVVEDDETTSRATRYVSRDTDLLLPQQRLQMIYDLSERLTKLQSRDRLFEAAMKICFETLHFERGAIGVRKPRERTLDWPVVHNLRGAEGELTISRTLLSRALEHGERAIYTDEGSGSADPTISMVQQGIRSAMCVPLLDQDQTMGVIYGDRISTSTSYSEEDIDFLAALARQVSIGLINCRLVSEQREMVRLNHEIDLARSIQTGLFPPKLPNRKDLRVAAINDPGHRVSGDYYDVIEADGGRVWCLIADVTGEGVAASLLMANLQAAARLTITEADDPGALLKRWNGLICRNTELTKFITCLLALIDPGSHQIRFASAGHCPPLIVRGGDAAPEELEIDAGYPLGVVETAEFATRTVDLGPDPFVFFCYTDGVTEAMNTDGEQFGRAQLLQTLTSLSDLNPQALVKEVRREVARFAEGASQSDDITMLAARIV
jgi:sigma-B regulation protein RsbU (phosphoserine phosphatase)